MAQSDRGGRTDVPSGGKYDETRRKLLGMLGAGVTLGIAGCAAEEDDVDDGVTDDTDDDETETPVDREIQRGGVLRVGLTENPASLDPPYSSGVPSSFVQNLIYESLVTSDTEGNLYPWLADSFELVEMNDLEEGQPEDYQAREAYEPYMIEAPVAEDDDGNRFIDVDEQIVVEYPGNNLQEDDTALVLTVNETQDAVDDGVFGMQFRYELHEGIEFHNGEEFTADNVVRTFERYENSMVAAQTFDAFLHAEAVDDYTVDLYSQVINAEAARELPGVSILPDEHIDLEGGGLDPRQGVEPVGTGPYEFETFEDEQYIIVTKNENYWMEDIGLENKEWWDGPEDFPNGPVIDEIDMDIIPDDATRSAALQNDEIDWAYGLSADTLDDYDADEGFLVSSMQAGGYDFLQYPMRVEPWDDQRLRRGVNHLIPRTPIAENIFRGWRDPAWTPLPELARGAGTADYDTLESILRPMNEYDPETAEELIQEVIDDRGLEVPIEIQMETNADSDDRVRTVELIAESMEQTGLFDVTVETYEFGAFVARILNPDYPSRGHMMYVGLSGTFNPDSFCAAVNHTRNIGQCCNATGVGWDDLDDMIDRALEGPDVAADPDLRAELYDDVWEIIVERSGTSYINISSNSAVMNTEVEGFNPYPFPEGMMSYGLYAPYDDQITWLARGG